MNDTDQAHMIEIARQAAEKVLKPALAQGRDQSARMMAISGELNRLVLSMAEENASSFAEAMGAIATAKTPLDSAAIYSQFLAASMQRISRQFTEVTQAVSSRVEKQAD